MTNPYDPDELLGAEAGDGSAPEISDQLRLALGHDLAADDVSDDAGAESADYEEATADLDDQQDLLAGRSSPMTVAGVEEVLNLRWPETQIEPSLERIQQLMDITGHPERAYPIIQVAGTNGKTSTARMIDALLSRVGLRTGRFTSPHLQKVTERISLDSTPIPDDRYVDVYTELAPFIDLVDLASNKAGGVDLSKFEVLTAMGFAAFADSPVDVAVIEVGLGGTWDSTNVADAQVAVIAPIGLDHTDYLGDTLTLIAGEKAGIIKAGSTAVIGRQDPEAMEVLLARAVGVGAAVARLDSEFSVAERDVAVGGQKLSIQGLGGLYPDIFLPLHGEHQADNAAVALAAVEAFFGAGPGRQLDIESVQDAFAAVASPGRLERVATNPTILLDAAHNPHGMSALATALIDEFSFNHLICVFAAMADKDVAGMLQQLSDVCDVFVVTQNSSARSMPVADLAALATDILGAERVHTASRMDGAMALAADLARNEDETTGVGIIVTGSVVSAGDARAILGRTPQ